ncbi:MAG: alkaline shock response membrane anchor protein AmaP [Bacillota bacterium]|nr:alkaline shock response membrane anchor protein AmaP [Bacillota bacterium]
MRTGTRILLVLFGIFGILSGFFLILLTLGVLNGTALFFAYNLEPFVGDLPYTALGFVILFVGVLLLVLSVPRGTRKEGGNIVSFTEIGEIRISFKAIENMVLAASRKVKGIRDVNTRIDSTEQGLLIYMRIKTIPDLPIPALVGELQSVVRDYVQEISGSNVAEVKVLVENIAQEKIQKNLR